MPRASRLRDDANGNRWNCRVCKESAVRFSALLLLGFWVGAAQANWTGVEVSLVNTDSDWDFDGEAREAQFSQLSLQIEENTKTGLRVGASLGQSSLRVVADDRAETRKFDTQFLAIYLRQPIELSQSVGLHVQLNLRYNTGEDNDEDDSADIDWNETDLQFGASFRFSHFRIMPFITYSDIDGDFEDDSGTQIFELEDPVSHGLALDYFVDSTAFVRLEMFGGNRSGGVLTFARRY